MENIWPVLIAAGVMTYLIRYSFIGLLDRWNMPPMLKQALRFVPPAVLSAIIFPAMFLSGNQLFLSLQNERLLAGIAAALVGWKTRNVLLTIAVGMAVLFALKAWLPG